MAKYYMTKQAGGVFTPESEVVAESLKRFKNGEPYCVEIKRSRNPHFHRKVFAFFGFCFQYWSGDKAGLENMEESTQFDRFRKDLTILAGFYQQSVRLNGDIRTEAQSLSYENMEQDEFEKVYSALINAALKHIFKNTKDQTIINQLYSYF